MFHRRTTTTWMLALAAWLAAPALHATDGTWDASWVPHDSDQKGIPGLFEDTWALGGTGPFAGDMTATAIAVQADGKQLVAGFGWNTYNGTDQNACIVRRYFADGSVDAAFGNLDGASVTNYASPGGNPKIDCYAKAVAVQADGKIVVAGQLAWSNGSQPQGWVMRLNADGTTDYGFGEHSGFSYFALDFAQVLLAGNGDILVAGSTVPQNFSDSDFYLATLDAAGQRKNEAWLTFGAAGSDGNETGSAAVLESWSSGTIGNFHSHDGVYIAGVVDEPGYAGGMAHHSCGIVAFTRTDGGNFSIDSGFGNGGLVNVDFPVGISDTDTICRTATKRPSSVIGFFGPTGVIVGGERYFVPTSGSGLASYYALAEVDSAGTVTRHDDFAYFADLNENGAYNSIFGLTWDNVGKLAAVGYAGIGANGNQQHAPSDGVVRRFNADYSVDGSFAADHSGTLYASLDTAGVTGVVQAQREWANAVAFDPLHGRIVFAGERSILLSLVPNLYAWFLGAVKDGNVVVSDRLFADGFD